MTRLFALLCSAAALAAAIPAAPAAAASGYSTAASEWAMDISAREARNIAESAYPRARVLDVRHISGGRAYFAVRMIEDGRRFDVRVDARTGRII
ncbi:MAG: PepSY domain-containing protein [Oceanicaulis sp.]